MQPHPHLDEVVLGAERHRGDLADGNAAIFELRGARTDARSVMELDGDCGTGFVDALKHQIACDKRGHHRHGPYERRPQAPALHDGFGLSGRLPDISVIAMPGVVLAAALSGSQMERGSKLAEARMVSTTRAV